MRWLRPRAAFLLAGALLRADLAGYYVLSFEKPLGRTGSHRVNVALVGRKGTVFSRTRYVD